MAGTPVEILDHEYSTFYPGFIKRLEPQGILITYENGWRPEHMVPYQSVRLASPKVSFKPEPGMPVDVLSRVSPDLPPCWWKGVIKTVVAPGLVAVHYEDYDESMDEYVDVTRLRLRNRNLPMTADSFQSREFTIDGNLLTFVRDEQLDKLRETSGLLSAHIDLPRQCLILTGNGASLKGVELLVSQFERTLSLAKEKRDLQSYISEGHTGLAQEVFQVPSNVLGIVIGKSGNNMKRARQIDGVRQINIREAGDHAYIEIRATTPEAVVQARELLDIAQEDVQVSENLIGRIIGSSGTHIREFVEKMGLISMDVYENSVRLMGQRHHVENAVKMLQAELLLFEDQRQQVQEIVEIRRQMRQQGIDGRSVPMTGYMSENRSPGGRASDGGRGRGRGRGRGSARSQGGGRGAERGERVSAGRSERSTDGASERTNSARNGAVASPKKAPSGRDRGTAADGTATTPSKSAKSRQPRLDDATDFKISISRDSDSRTVTPASKDSDDHDKVPQKDAPTSLRSQGRGRGERGRGRGRGGRGRGRGSVDAEKEAAQEIGAPQDDSSKDNGAIASADDAGKEKTGGPKASSDKTPEAQANKGGTRQNQGRNRKNRDKDSKAGDKTGKGQAAPKPPSPQGAGSAELAQDKKPADANTAAAKPDENVTAPAKQAAASDGQSAAAMSKANTAEAPAGAQDAGKRKQNSRADGEARPRQGKVEASDAPAKGKSWGEQAEEDVAGTGNAKNALPKRDERPGRRGRGAKQAKQQQQQRTKSADSATAADAQLQSKTAAKTAGKADENASVKSAEKPSQNAAPNASSADKKDAVAAGGDNKAEGGDNTATAGGKPAEGKTAAKKSEAKGKAVEDKTAEASSEAKDEGKAAENKPAEASSEAKAKDEGKAAENKPASSSSEAKAKDEGKPAEHKTAATTSEAEETSSSAKGGKADPSAAAKSEADDATASS